MTPPELHRLESMYRSAEEQREAWLVENEGVVIELLNEIFSGVDEVTFTFTELLAAYTEMGYSFADLVLDMLDAGEGLKEGDWSFEDTITIGALEMAGPAGLA